MHKAEDVILRFGAIPVHLTEKTHVAVYTRKNAQEIEARAPHLFDLSVVSSVMNFQPLGRYARAIAQKENDFRDPKIVVAHIMASGAPLGGWSIYSLSLQTHFTVDPFRHIHHQIVTQDFAGLLVVLRAPDYSRYVVLQREPRLAVADPAFLGVSAGHVETGEKPEAAALREFQEETSIDLSRMKMIQSIHLGDFFPAPGMMTATSHGFMREYHVLSKGDAMALSGLRGGGGTQGHEKTETVVMPLDETTLQAVRCTSSHIMLLRAKIILEAQDAARAASARGKNSALTPTRDDGVLWGVPGARGTFSKR